MVYMYIGIVRLWHIKHLKTKYYCIILKFLRNKYNNNQIPGPL